MTAATLAQKIIEGDSVRRWRLEELVRAGYDPGDALVLSGRRDVDIHDAIRLVRRGCPPKTAVRILI
ncbi:MAG TPA: hypothetical protein VE088_08290 [Gaiellaceae bacterium]|jgi:hypothetical protein|nr:hypothetical protein [Gaiellaceae bacterium]